MKAADGQPEALAQVSVPATSANLGPGFDVLAVALDLPLVVRAVLRNGDRVVASGEGADEVPTDDSNLVWRGLRAFGDVFATAVPDVTLQCENSIPLERGLGSSAAAVVAGLVLGRALTGAPVADQDVIDLAAQLEGHADNAAAAVLGGLVVAGPNGPARRFEPTPNLRPIVCIPATRLATSTARGLVPAGVSLETLVATTRRTALVLAGLAGMSAWDPTAMTDEVHEPPRLDAMRGSKQLVDSARGAGYGACLSGAGPTVLVLAEADDRAVVGRLRAAVDDQWLITAVGWDRAGARSNGTEGSA